MEFWDRENFGEGSGIWMDGWCGEVGVVGLRVGVVGWFWGMRMNGGYMDGVMMRWM